MCTLQERVKQGAKLLDKKCPDWFSKINIKKLDLSDCFSCIIGQIYGDYLFHQSNLFFDVIEEGTNVEVLCEDNGLTVKYGEYTYSELTKLWKEEIFLRWEKEESELCTH